MAIEIYDYIIEQPAILTRILNNSKQMTRDFADIFKRQKVSKLILAGSGSSYNAACSSRYFMQKLLGVEVSARFAHDFYSYEDIVDRDSILVGISQSGESTAAVDCLKKANELGVTCIAVTSEDGSLITEYSKHKMVVPSGEEKAGATTKGYTATVLAFYLAAIEAAYVTERIDEGQYNHYINNILKLIGGINKIIDQTNEWYEIHRDEMMDAKNIIVSGYGNNFGTALEAGLKFMETSRIPTSIYEVEEFMHGPYNLIDESSFIFFIVPEGKGKERTVRLNEYFSDKTKNSYMLINQSDSEDDHKNLRISFFEDIDLTPLEYVIPFQVLFYRLAKDKGIDNRLPRYIDFHVFMKSKRKLDFLM